MRISREFGKRSNIPRQTKIKYLLAFEGEKTEVQYFKGVIDHRQEIGINPLISIIPLQREESESGNSHPKWMLNELSTTIQRAEETGCLYDEDENEITFDRELDKVCLIFDRDEHNFKHDPYTEVVEAGEKNNIQLYITNPSFEFWLLLHSDRVFDYPPDRLFLNRRINKKRYLEECLQEVFGRYNKSKIQFADYKSNIKTAIRNEQHFCEDILGLNDNLGSNVGLLMQALLTEHTEDQIEA